MIDEINCEWGKQELRLKMLSNACMRDLSLLIALSKRREY